VRPLPSEGSTLSS